jgi:drug/metabolite transporter (DMT)-like permease
MALLVILLWGSNYSVQKALMAHIGPGALLFARYLVTPACAVLLLLWNHGLHWPRVQRRDWLALAGLAVLGHLGQVSVMTNATHLSTAFSSALISALGPMFTLLLVRLLYRQRLAGVQVAGIALAFAGMLVFMADKLAVVRTQGLGDLLLLLGTMLFSAHTVAASKLIDRHGVMVVMAYSTLLAMTPMVLINTPQAMGVAWSSLPPALWWGLLYSLAVPSFAGWLAWGWLNTHVGVQRTAPLLYLLPPVAGIISWIALGESFSGLKIVGAIMAGAGVAITQFAARPTPATELVKREQPPDATV